MGCSMGKCLNCNVEVLDETEVCPLCRSVLEQSDELENMYPDVRVSMRKYLFLSRIYLVIGILVEIVLVLINANDEHTVWWSAISGLGILYSYMVFRYAIIGKSGYRSKVTVLLMIGVLSTIAADFIIGYRGWSVDYVLPAGILLTDIVILGCMIFNVRNWQSYLMWQLTTILLALIPMLLNIFELEQNRFLAFAPLAVSLALFFGTLFIGGHRAREELCRRFHLG